jgi:hypothetical protein
VSSLGTNPTEEEEINGCRQLHWLVNSHFGHPNSCFSFHRMKRAIPTQV